MPSAIGVSFMILKLRFTIRTVSNSFETNFPVHFRLRFTSSTSACNLA
jgi:hypothetical protein